MACMLMSRGTSPNQLEIESTAPRCAFTTLNFMARQHRSRRSILTTQRKKLSRRAGQLAHFFCACAYVRGGKQFRKCRGRLWSSRYGNIDPQNASTSSGHVAELSQNSCVRQVARQELQESGPGAGSAPGPLERRGCGGSAQRSAKMPTHRTHCRCSILIIFRKKADAPGGC